MRFEVLTVVKMSMLVFWVVTQYALKKEVYVPPKCWYLPTSPHGVTTEKTNIFFRMR
jgi:hypothetical protein